MSDEAKDGSTPEVKLDAAGGFMPDPPPPSMTAEEAGVPAEGADGEIQIANTMPDGSVAVPHDTAKRALEAVQILAGKNLHLEFKVDTVYKKPTQPTLSQPTADLAYFSKANSLPLFL